MRKRIFVLIIILMSIALIGIISVQVFWIKNTIQITEDNFSTNVKIALGKVSEDIKENEFQKYYLGLRDIYHKGEIEGPLDVSKFIYEKIDTVRNEKLVYSQSIIEQHNRIPTDYFDTLDTIDFKEIFSKEETLIIKDDDMMDIPMGIDPNEESIVKIGRLVDAEKAKLAGVFRVHTSRLPIHKRISNKLLTLKLDRELKKKGIDTEFKYGIYSNGLATQVKSGYFRKEMGRNYRVPMFADDEGHSQFHLHVIFPEKKNFILGSISKILGLSAMFIMIIILSFVTALYQLIKQKQISEIKTDFINNMTHEFKTPIATINLALDAIKNPKIIEDKDKVMRYVKMIRDENKRMHAQVENVLRISKLEKNQLDVSKEKVDAHDLIEEAISHVELLVKDKGGYIKSKLGAGLTEILANQFHFTNVIVNMLDNAIKYSDEAPKIDISTQNTPKNLVIRVKDQGIGMSKGVQKNVFKKFYREERGNIHNVKGHGLGLSYVKKIIEIHQGEVYVESEKSIGSTFTIKLPLI